MNRIARHWRRRPWLTVLLLVALVSRALVPQGFMPGHGGLILCAGYAPVLNAEPPDRAVSGRDMAGMDMNVHDHGHGSGGVPHSHDDAGTGTCPFAAAASVMAPVHAVPALLIWQVTSTITSFPPEKPLPRGTIVPTRLPRGPPA
jgi:hypothetical protein